MSTKESQVLRIKKWLLSGRTLTPMQALSKFGCFRLGARIYDLRKEYTIINIKDDGGYAKYRMAL